jgi:hypothetical protein
MIRADKSGSREQQHIWTTCMRVDIGNWHHQKTQSIQCRQHSSKCSHISKQWTQGKQENFPFWNFRHGPHSLALVRTGQVAEVSGPTQILTSVRIFSNLKQHTVSKSCLSPVCRHLNQSSITKGGRLMNSAFHMTPSQMCNCRRATYSINYHTIYLHKSSKLNVRHCNLQRWNSTQGMLLKWLSNNYYKQHLSALIQISTRALYCPKTMWQNNYLSVMHAP